MNRLSSERREEVLTQLNEGISVRSTSRVPVIARQKILNLIAEAGSVRFRLSGRASSDASGIATGLRSGKARAAALLYALPRGPVRS